MTRIGRVGILLALWLGLSTAEFVPAARAGEVVETYDDGTPKAKYATDDQGRKEGKYVSFHPNGKVAVSTTYHADQIDGKYVENFDGGKTKIRATYKSGKRNGHYQEWASSGDPVLEADYAADRLNGRLTFFRGKRAVSSQDWSNGELTYLDGELVAPKAIDAVRKTIASILAGDFDAKPDPKGKSAPRGGGESTGAPKLSEETLIRHRTALRRLMAYRYICDVPFEGMTLGEKPTAYAQAAADLCMRLGQLTHKPTNPGMAQDAFEFAAEGTHSCNLHQVDVIRSVDGYMDDSDPSNIDRVGHRRWCLNPPMLTTGFGEAAGASGTTFTAMYAMDRGRDGVSASEVVCYPPRGWTPVEFFGKRHAWSVSFGPSAFPRPTSSVQVRLYRLGADFVRPEEPVELDRVGASTEGFGLPFCVIFRPKEAEVADGAAYWVEISGLDPTAKNPAAGVLRYVVRFFALK